MSRIPTPPETLVIINKMYKDVEDLLSNLHFRWQCEREYEDFKEYGEAIKKALQPQIVLKDMTKRPFGFRFRVKGFEQALYCVKLTNRSYSWERVE
jgi:hypothetical protein